MRLIRDREPRNVHLLFHIAPDPVEASKKLKCCFTSR